MIGIINYRVGNLFNLANALQAVGYNSRILDTPAALFDCDRLVLPGVGAFAHAVEQLQSYGFHDPLIEYIASGKPVLGICVGMQILFEEGHEHGLQQGMGVIPGAVRRLKVSQKVPHMGWNQLNLIGADPLTEGIANQSWFYFVHSYVCHPAHTPGSESYCKGTTDYEQTFCSFVRKDNVWGVQFHPEKSQTAGLTLLKNFCEY